MSRLMPHIFIMFLCFPLFANKGVVYVVADHFWYDKSRDDCRKPFCDVRDALIKAGYVPKKTSSLKNLHDAVRIICWDIPMGDAIKGLKQYPKEKLVVFLSEPPTVKLCNFDKKNHEYFSRIYTWKDDLIDNKKYFKYAEPQPRFNVIENPVPFDEKRLSVYITCNKNYSHPLSLSPERRKIVSFFENLDESEFDLYGVGWPQGFSKNYEGTVKSKVDCMTRYKFCFCYENMRDIEGYITGEKILNVFVAGCVPIFWGASNIEQHIPKNCFIDKRDFENYEELYQFLKNMGEQEYQQYLENIRAFMKSGQALIFSGAYLAHLFLEVVEPGYDMSVALTVDQNEAVEKVLSYIDEKV